MILHVNDNWEINNPVLKAIDPPGTRRYMMVEISLNVPLFLLEAIVSAGEGSEPSLWQKFLLSDYEDVQGFLLANDLQDHRISLLLPRYKNKDDEFAISTITEIYAGLLPDGQRCRLFVCANGRRELDTLGAWEEDNLVEKTLVYRKDKRVASSPFEDRNNRGNNEDASCCPSDTNR